MGAKNWMLIGADGDVRTILAGAPALDRQATRELVERVWAGRRITPIEDGTLADDAAPREPQVYAGVYPGLTVVCAFEIGVDRPSDVPERLLGELRGAPAYLHVQHSVVDFFGYAVWAADGTLTRSLSLAPDSGIMENVGEPLPFEKPYWNGERALDDDDEGPYPLPFHPLEMADDAVRALFGFGFESWTADDPDTGRLTLAGFEIR